VNLNPKANTCGALCTAAKHNGRTHAEQMAWELASPDTNIVCCRGCGRPSYECTCWDTPNTRNVPTGTQENENSK